MRAASELERVRDLLAGAGFTWTRPRAAVLRVLASAGTPLKVEEIHERVGSAAAGRAVNLSSVYRTVNLLHGLGLVHRTRLGEGALRYELAEVFRGHHHHFVCEACGRIEDVSRCPLEGADLGAGSQS